MDMGPRMDWWMPKSEYIMPKIKSPQCFRIAKEWKKERNKSSCIIKKVIPPRYLNTQTEIQALHIIKGGLI